MTTPNKVKASAGAEWLLGGFGVLKKAPLGLGLLGLIFGIVSVLPVLFAAAGPVAMVLAQLVLAVVTPVLLGGVVHAVREVDQGRAAQPGHILQGLREGKALALMAQVLPQIAAGIVIMLLLVVFIGPTHLQNLAVVVEQAQQGVEPDPALFSNFPAGGFVLWALAAMVIGLAVYAITFLVPAQVMFDGRGPFQAMKRSVCACFRSFAAFLVFVVLLLVIALAIAVGAQIAALVLGLIFGELAAILASQLLMMMVLVPVLSGAGYVAWQQLLGDGTGAVVTGDAPPPPASGIEV